MKISTPIENGLLPDKYGKYAPESAQKDGTPIVSLPISIEDAPSDTVSFALCMVDFDAIAPSGFCWIHWVACNIPGTVREIPEDASRTESVPMIQGKNSQSSRFVGCTDPALTLRYTGPCPPDADHEYTLTVYALDDTLDLSEGYGLNDLRRAMRGHIIDSATIDVWSRF